MQKSRIFDVRVRILILRLGILLIAILHQRCRIYKFFFSSFLFNINENIRFWELTKKCTAWKVSKYRLFSGPYFPVFGLNTEIYGVIQENTDQKIVCIWTLFTQWCHQKFFKRGGAHSLWPRPLENNYRILREMNSSYTALETSQT